MTIIMNNESRGTNKELRGRMLPIRYSLFATRYSSGFTLIEVLVVVSITVIFTGLLVANFSRTRVDLNQTALTVKDAIREAQSMALSGALFGTPGTARCGYGIHFEDTRYVIYAGPVADATACFPKAYVYDANGGIVRQGLLSNAVLEIVTPAPDIFFEPPDPKTYIIGGSADTTATIIIRRKGIASCPSADCRQINVTTSGQIQ